MDQVKLVAPAAESEELFAVVAALPRTKLPVGEFTKAAESQIAENNRKLVSMFDEASKLAPAGSENAVAMMKSTLETASSGYEQLTKSTKMAVEAMESNINAAATQLTQAASKASGRSKK